MKAASVRYTISLVLTKPIREGESLNDYIGIRAETSVERDIIAALSKLDGDATVECDDVELLDGDDNIITPESL